MQGESAGGHKLIIGFQEEWQDFENRNSEFLDRFRNIETALGLAFPANVGLSEPVDKFVLVYGRVCAEDFFEILLCCGNGNGHAAEKLLRGLYERAVTLRYLHEHPNEIHDFLDYYWVSQHKLMIACKQTMGEEVFPQGACEEIEREYQATKDKFMVPDCKGCGTKKLNHTWSKLDFAAMARTSSLGKLIALGYYIPLRDAHATVASMLSRIEAGASDGIQFKQTAQRKVADNALRVSHNVFLDVLRVEDEHFGFARLKEQNELCLQDFIDIWRRPMS